MAVSKAVVPLLKGEAARSFRKTLDSSHIRSYSSHERTATDKAVSAILDGKNRRCQNGQKSE